VIQEAVVLLWVEHLQQRAGGISIVSTSNLVNFINEDKRILRLDAFQSLDDLPW